jgi:hypothetical protein
MGRQLWMRDSSESAHFVKPNDPVSASSTEALSGHSATIVPHGSTIMARP